MIWRNWCWLGLAGWTVVVAGCDYTPKKSANITAESYGPLPGQPRSSSRAVIEDPASERPSEPDPEIAKRREVILNGVVKLMQTAYNNPGGRNFEIATENLNELFEQGTTSKDFASTPDSKDFLTQKIFQLTKQDPTNVVKALSSPRFTIRDARHIEDCMLYHSVALRVAGEGDDLTRVRRIFDWLVRNVQLVPPNSLGGNGIKQAQARPADVLFRGMATENGSWSERGWLFMSLCRQIGIDVGILTYSPRRPSSMAITANTPEPPVISWVSAALINDKAYLFDPRIGLEIPSLDGSSVATLNEVMTNPEILERLDLPGQSNLGVSAADLAASPTKIGVLIDSSIGYLAPRMRLLQGQLRGDSRTILFRDPGEQGRHFIKALGARLGDIYLWSLPIQVEDLLFSNPDFVAATQASLQFFDNKYALLFARTAQLRGELAAATERYIALRFVESPVTSDGKDTPIPPEVQRALDIYASYFIALNHLDQGNPGKAEDVFRKMLDLVPDPGPGRYFYYMLRWGALNNLGRICEARGDIPAAIAYYSASDNSNGMITPQHHGNLIRARRLLWTQPASEPITALPPSPSALVAPDVAGPTSIAPMSASRPGIPASIAAP